MLGKRADGRALFTAHSSAKINHACMACVQGVCHRDLKLENTLLDGRPAPRLKICDFGYSKVPLFWFHSARKA